MADTVPLSFSSTYELHSLNPSPKKRSRKALSASKHSLQSRLSSGMLSIDFTYDVFVA